VNLQEKWGIPFIIDTAIMNTDNKDHLDEQQQFGSNSSLKSKTAFVAELVPGNRNLVEFSIELANTPGALAEVATVLSKHQVNILTGFHDSTQWSFFADLTKIESSIDGIVKEISSLAPVSKVFLGEGLSEGIIVDTLHQQLMWGPFRTLIVRADVVSSILDRVKGIFGADGKAGKAIVYGMGEAAGRTFYRGIARQIKTETIKSRLKDVVGLDTAQGWGDFRLTSMDLNKTTASVTVLNGFECVRLQGADSPSATSTCDFVRGHLAGLFSEMFGKRMDASETLCVARGDAKCQFEIVPSTTTPAKAST
jgi:predicted hydrocarbon binding protein/ACT domain-containing protein